MGRLWRPGVRTGHCHFCPLLIGQSRSSDLAQSPRSGKLPESQVRQTSKAQGKAHRYTSVKAWIPSFHSPQGKGRGKMARDSKQIKSDKRAELDPAEPQNSI